MDIKMFTEKIERLERQNQLLLEINEMQAKNIIFYIQIIRKIIKERRNEK